jgi:hypothetical protein
MVPMGKLSELLSEDDYRILQRLGLTVMQDEFFPEAFGNALIIWGSPVLRLRIVRDRGPLLADVTAPAEPEDWIPLNNVLPLFGRPEQKPKECTMGSLLRAVEDVYAPLVEALPAERLEDTRKRAREVGNRRAIELFGSKARRVLNTP